METFFSHRVQKGVVLEGNSIKTRLDMFIWVINKVLAGELSGKIRRQQG